jgi:hypothetical protein
VAPAQIPAGASTHWAVPLGLGAARSFARKPESGSCAETAPLARECFHDRRALRPDDSSGDQAIANFVPDDAFATDPAHMHSRTRRTGTAVESAVAVDASSRPSVCRQGDAARRRERKNDRTDRGCGPLETGRLRAQDLISPAWSLRIEVGVRAAAVRGVNAGAPLSRALRVFVMPGTAGVLAAPVAFGRHVRWAFSGVVRRLSGRLFVVAEGWRPSD